MPDIHEGLDLSPERSRQGELSDSTGSQLSSTTIFPRICMNEAIESRVRQVETSTASILLGRSELGRPGLELLDLSRPEGPRSRLSDSRVQLTLEANRAGPSPPIVLDSAKWARLGEGVWRTNRHKVDVVPPPRDVPAWLHCIPALCCPHIEESLQESFHEGELPMRYGIELDPPGPYAAHPVETTGFAHFEAKNMVSAPLIQFPMAVLPPPSRHPGNASQLDDGVLPFRATAKHTLAVFSLAGGTGRTSLAAGLARLLSGAGLRVLLADTSSFSLLPRLFGATESRQGVVRNFFPETGQKNRMISLISLAVEPFAGDDYEQYRILQELNQQAARVDRVVWDLSGAPLDWAAKVLGTNPQILVPLLPSANSLMQLRATERFLNRCHEEDPTPHLRYVLNHFDDGDVRHTDIREQFQKQLGSKLLRVSMRRSPLVDEALSCGKTVIDHAPASSLVNDLWHLAQQLHQVDEVTDVAANSPCAWFEH